MILHKQEVMFDLINNCILMYFSDITLDENYQDDTMKNLSVYSNTKNTLYVVCHLHRSLVEIRLAQAVVLKRTTFSGATAMATSAPLLAKEGKACYQLPDPPHSLLP